MTTKTFVNSRSMPWLRRGIAVAGALLLGGMVALGNSAQPPQDATRSADHTSGATVARDRHEAFKAAQAELHDATLVFSPTQPSWGPQRTALKERQVEQRENLLWGIRQIVPGVHARSIAFKDQQADQHDVTAASTVVRFTDSAWFSAFKQAQAEQHDSTVVPMPTVTPGSARFAEMKARQAEQHEPESR